MDTSINSPIDKAAEISKWVWYSSNAALEEGEAVCYNWDYTGDGATYREPRRYNEVETPTTLNAQHFAGVSAAAYAAKSGGQLIQIFVPGSICNIRLGKDASTVIGVGILTFDVTASFKGQFRYSGLDGEGSAQPLQTVTADATNTAMCLAKLQTGLPSGGVEVVPIVDNDVIGTLMLAGTTLVTGGALAGGNCTYTLADGTFTGQRKKFKVITTEITTSDLVVTVTTGTESWGSGDLDTLTWAGAQTTLNKSCTLVWDGAWVATRMTKTEPTPA